MKWIAPAMAYLAVGLGLFLFHNAFSALMGFHIAIILSLLIAKPKVPLSILWKSTNIKWTLLSILLCGSSGVMLYFTWDRFGPVSDLHSQVKGFDLNSSTWIPFIVYFTLVNPFVEEYFWRGYLGSDTKSLHISDFLYSGFHGLILFGKVRPSSILLSLTLLVLVGWFWRQLYREDKGLLAPVLGHMAADFTILLAVYNMTV
ncbi:MAG: CPBP family intramembrane metalloprotease [Anaerolineales bacterium]